MGCGSCSSHSGRRNGRLTDPPASADRALFHRVDLRLLREQLAAASFQVADEEDITANVVRALELNTPKMRARIERRFPRFLHQHALAFVATADSPSYQAFTDGKLTYMRFVLDRV